MSLKNRINALTSSLPPDPNSLCCFTLSFETSEPYHARVWERYARGPLPESPPEFLPTCTKHAEPCSEATRHACAVWRNIARCEHLRDLPAELLE